MSATISVGLAPITTRPGEPEKNRERSLTAAEELFRQGANVVVLPELIASGYSTDRVLMLSVAEAVDGPTVRAWQALAERAQGVIVGGFCERLGDAVQQRGRRERVGSAAAPRKLHRFSSEKECFTPGDLGLPVAETPFGPLAVCVCYDLRFVETARALSLQGAALIGVPTAWLPGFDDERWDEHGLCPQARSCRPTWIRCTSPAHRSPDQDREL